MQTGICQEYSVVDFEGGGEEVRLVSFEIILFDFNRKWFYAKSAGHETTFFRRDCLLLSSNQVRWNWPGLLTIGTSLSRLTRTGFISE